MVQRACEYLEKAPDKETSLRLLDTLRTVTEGKVANLASCLYLTLLPLVSLSISTVVLRAVCRSTSKSKGLVSR